MIKQQIQGLTLKEQLLARKKDRIHIFTLSRGQIRGALIHGTFMIREMRASHNTGILETLILGHAYLGVSLMASNLKKGGRIAFKIDCQGPLKGLSVEASAQGEVRGYLQTNPIPIDKAPESFDTSPFFGEGLLEVINYSPTNSQPYTGKINLEYGRLAMDLANYYLLSEQIPTVFNLSLKFNKTGDITGAGGLLLQSMPGADEKLIDKLESLVVDLPSIGNSFEMNIDSETYIRENFRELNPQVLANRRVEFFCHCSKERVATLLKGMGTEVLKDILKKDEFPQENICHNCNSMYTFNQEEIESILHKIK
jgi:molecular chaperone Hsp33